MMKVFVLFISFFLCLNVYAQKRCCKTIDNSTIKNVQNIIYRKSLQSTLLFYDYKGKPCAQKEDSIIRKIDNSVIILKSGTNWAVNSIPEKPMFFCVKKIIGNNNSCVIDYQNFIDFCLYYEEHGTLNYSEIKQLSIDRDVIISGEKKCKEIYDVLFDEDGNMIIVE